MERRPSRYGAELDKCACLFALHGSKTCRLKYHGFPSQQLFFYRCSLTAGIARCQAQGQLGGGGRFVGGGEHGLAKVIHCLQGFVERPVGLVSAIGAQNQL